MRGWAWIAVVAGVIACLAGARVGYEAFATPAEDYWRSPDELAAKGRALAMVLGAPMALGGLGMLVAGAWALRTAEADRRRRRLLPAALSAFIAGTPGLLFALAIAAQVGISGESVSDFAPRDGRQVLAVSIGLLGLVYLPLAVALGLRVLRGRGAGHD